MKFSNLNIRKKAIAMALAGTLATATLTGCGNKQVLDFNKSFNVALETNNGYLSIAAIKEYSDYSGDQVQFRTEDGLLVLSSTHQTQLIKITNTESLQNYALALVGNDSEKIIDYNKMQGISINTAEYYMNKNYLDFNYTFDKAIILSEETATIVNLQSWTDYEDDKIQIQLSDGNYILTNIDNVKLVNDDETKENSLYNYAVSLVGSEEKVITYEKNKTKSK